MKSITFFLLLAFPFLGFAQLQTDTVVDIDGNVYHTVKIGTQTWMVENLKVTRFNNGDSIPHLPKTTDWIKATGPAYCMYNDMDDLYRLSEEQKVELSKRMGKFYNRYVIQDPRNIAPKGWRVPGLKDVKVLEDFLGGSKIAGAKLKDTLNWSTHFSFNTNTLHTTNKSGFTALPDGYRGEKGEFSGISEQTRWWMKQQAGDSDFNWYGWCLFNTKDPLFDIPGWDLNGYSVRCLKE